MNNTVPQKVYDLLKKVVKDDIKSYSINIQDQNKKGDGFLGVIYFVSLQRKNSNEILNFVVKQALDDESTRTTFPIRDMYINEIHIYTKVWPTFQEFQNIIPSSKLSNVVAKCVGESLDEGFEQIILEDLKFYNFKLYNKKNAFDEEHVKFTLKEYGKFHALSFAYRAINPEKYSKLAQDLKDIYRQYFEVDAFRLIIESITKLSLESLKPGTDDNIIQKFKRYIENIMDTLEKSNEYKGKYSVILHGDCWSNNMMFKYDESGKLIDMRFLDFQNANEGNPVCDVSHFLYAGASKEILDELDFYLKVYHDSLSESLKQFNLNSEVIYPFQVLKNDWKRYCHRGFSMSLLVWKNKCTSEENVLDFQDFRENIVDLYQAFNNEKHDGTVFKKITRDLILHMYDNNYL